VSKVASLCWSMQQFFYEDEMFHVAHWFPAFIILLFVKLILVITAIIITVTYAPASAGSGVPELRAILSGIWIREYLGKTTLVAKTIALMLSLSSGLPIGLEGPFIHLSAIVARQLTRLSFFVHLDRKQVCVCVWGQIHILAHFL